MHQGSNQASGEAQGCAGWLLLLQGTGSLPHGERFEAWYSFSVSG